MLREMGWTVAEYLDQPLADVLDLVDHLAEEPPAYRILAWKYLKPKKKTPSQQEFLQQQGEVMAMMGEAPRPMPEYLKQMIRNTEEQLAKLNKSEPTPHAL